MQLPVPAWWTKLVAAVCIGLVPLMLISPSSPLGRLLKPDQSDTESSDSRLGLWKHGLLMFAESPLFGVGVGNFQPLMRQRTNDPALDHIAHNTYIEIAAELGLAGFVLFGAVVFGTLKTLRRVRDRAARLGPPLLHAGAEGLEVGIVAFLVGAFFVSAQYQKLFWLAVFLSMCLPRFSRRATQMEAKQHVPEALAAAGVPTHWTAAPVRPDEASVAIPSGERRRKGGP